jgi:hypothetical protein
LEVQAESEVHARSPRLNGLMMEGRQSMY